MSSRNTLIVKTEVYLYNNSLSGEIPASLWALDLRVFMAYANTFSGSLEDVELGSTLEVLDLSYNKFSGPVPASLVGLKLKLRYLSFDHNKFSGDIPSFISGFQHLDYLFVSLLSNHI
jgi:hypothetical protein